MTTQPTGGSFQGVVSLTVRSSAWKFLAEHVDPGREELVFVWGVQGAASETGWAVAVLPREDESFPEDAFFRARLGDYTLVVPQNTHVAKLNGCTLQCRNRELCVT